MKTISYTMPVTVPNLPIYEKIQEDVKKGADYMHELLEDGWRMIAVNSVTSHEVVYNTYILEK